MNAPTSERPAKASPEVGFRNGPSWHGWTRRERPLRLERRLEFPDYEATRVYLERAGALSESLGIYPNLSFGRTYVNLGLFADEDSGELTAEALVFAERIDQLSVQP